jgi:hypothetical protein
VAHICNLVQEFNGLVSKGPVAILALLLFMIRSFAMTKAYLFPASINRFLLLDSFPAFLFTTLTAWIIGVAPVTGINFIPLLPCLRSNEI